MVTDTRLIVWDHDRVLIPSLVTSILARTSTRPVAPFVEDLRRLGWVDEQQIELWCARTNRALHGVADLADLLTDFLYEFRREDGCPYLAKEQVKSAKQRLLRGLSVREILRTLEQTPWTEGLLPLIREWKAAALRQVICSDTLEIVVKYQAQRLGFEAALGVPAVLTSPPQGIPRAGRREHFMDWALDATLTGEILPFDKAAALWAYCERVGIRRSQVMLIDDSAANLQTLFLPIRDAGGVAVAFNPTASHTKEFAAASVPVLSADEVSKLQDLLHGQQHQRPYPSG